MLGDIPIADAAVILDEIVMAEVVGGGRKDDGVVGYQAGLDHRAPAVHLFPGRPILFGRGRRADEDVVAAFRVAPVGLVDHSVDQMLKLHFLGALVSVIAVTRSHSVEEGCVPVRLWERPQSWSVRSSAAGFYAGDVGPGVSYGGVQVGEQVVVVAE